MAQKYKIKAILMAARRVRDVLDAASPDMVIDATLEERFRKAYDATEATAEEYARKRSELTGLRIRRDNHAKELNGLVTRFRSGIMGHYGPDSVEYGRAGGTRTSERKRPARKAKKRKQ